MPTTERVQAQAVPYPRAKSVLLEALDKAIRKATPPGYRDPIDLIDDRDDFKPIKPRKTDRKSARNCAILRSFPNLERKISVVDQGVLGGVKLPLWAPRRVFDTDTIPDTLSEPSDEPEVDALGAAMVMAYDTEWQARGDGSNDVLSYQIAAFEPAGGRWVEFVIYVEDDQRATLADLIEETRVRLGLRPKDLQRREILVVAHFGAAEWSALRDRVELAQHLQLIRRVPVTLGAVAVKLRMNNRPVQVMLRSIDTYLLAPDGNQQLAKLGDVVGIPKVTLRPGAIERMAELRDTDPSLFELYGIQDARVTLGFLMRMIDTAKRELGLTTLPLTTGGISVRAFLDSVGEEAYLEIFGLEKIRQHKKTRIEQVPARAHTESFFAMGFSGGLNNAVPSVVAPGDNRVVYDIDFVSAYPAAAATLPIIDWSPGGVRNGIESGHFTAEGGGGATAISLSFVRFRFPPNTARPCIPVSAGSRGIIYPLEGEGYATGPEIAMARAKGCHIEIDRQERLPYRVDADGNARLAFAPFLGEMVARRRTFPKGSIENLLYKLISNAFYGKLAQGVRPRSVRSFGQRGALPASKLSCPAYAAAITGTVRAALIALQDAVEECGGVVHSATTDGCTVSFPGSPETHPSLASIDGLEAAIMRKPAIRAMHQGLLNMGVSGDTPLELKAVGDSCEVWKTRGYVIKLGEKVLHVGRAGHQLSAEELSERASDDEISQWEMKSLSSAQSIFDGKHADLISLRSSRRVNLDYDFKLLPDGRGGYRPPRDLDEFMDWRDSADAIRRQGRRATESRVALAAVGVQQRGGETTAVRRQLLRALIQDVGGIRPVGLTDREVAELLGFTATDAKNAKRRPFKALPRSVEIERIASEILASAGIPSGGSELLLEK